MCHDWFFHHTATVAYLPYNCKQNVMAYALCMPMHMCTAALQVDKLLNETCIDHSAVISTNLLKISC